MSEIMMVLRSLIVVFVLSASTSLHATPQEDGGKSSSRNLAYIEEAFAELEEPMKRQIDDAFGKQRESATDPILGRDFPIDPHPGDHHNPWNDVFQVARLDNPMVTEECRDRAQNGILERVGDRDAVAGHVRSEEAAWDEVREGRRTVRLSEYLDHLHKCKEACGPYVGRLLSCHVAGVRDHSRMVVLFGPGHPRRSDVRSFRFNREDEEDLRQFMTSALDQDKNLLLLSRASILHPREDIHGNRAVASRRAEVVERWLTTAGFPGSKITKKVLTWEPPRLDSREVSRAYGFDALWRAQNNKQHMDQSVVLVSY